MNLINNNKLPLWCQEEARASKKIEAEDIEKMSDSNQDIKNRLSETVRDNAKHLLDPHRKVNGEPVPAQQPQLFTGGVMRWYQIEGIEWLRVSTVLLPDSLLYFSVLLYYFLAKLDTWTFLKGKDRIKSSLSLLDFSISSLLIPLVSCVTADVVGKWHQWNSG